MSVLLVNTHLSAQSLPVHLELIKIMSVSLLFTTVRRKLLPLLAGHGASFRVGCCCNEVANSSIDTNPVSLLEAGGLH